jgi:hypothetical protein
MGLDKAIQLSQREYDEWVAARMALQNHERDHDCWIARPRTALKANSIELRFDRRWSL